MSAAVPPSLASLRAMVERLLAARVAYQNATNATRLALLDACHEAAEDLEGAVIESPSLLLRLIADAEALDAIDADLDDFRWLRPEPHPDGGLVQMDWFVGDGGGHTLTTGTTIREATAAYLAARSPHTGGEV